MKTSGDRLRWFIEFAQLDRNLAGVKEWEYLKLKEEVVEFVVAPDSNEQVHLDVKQEPLDYDDYGPVYGPSRKSIREAMEEWLTKERLLELLEYSGDYLGGFLPSSKVMAGEPIILAPFKLGSPEKPVPKPTTERKTKFRIVPKERRDTIWFGTPNVSFRMSTASWIVEAAPMNLFFIRFGLALMQEGTSAIQSCPACGRAFYRVRKQQYCSKTCINRVSRRNWLENPKNKKKERQWAHERYERRVKEKTKGNVKVESRSRKGGKH
jgi:hypothetical protein